MRGTTRLALALVVTGAASCAAQPPPPTPSPSTAPAPASQAATQPASQPGTQPASRPKARSTDPRMATGRQLTALLYKQDYEGLYAKFSDRMKAALPLEALRETMVENLKALGPEIEVIDEVITTPAPEMIGYARNVRFKNIPDVLQVSIVHREDGTLEGFFIKKPAVAAASEFDAYETKTDLTLPFDGEWTVIWGGRKVEENHHVPHANQKFAYDILIVRDGKTHTGDGSKNEDYYCFGQPLRAPADGVVAHVATGVADNVPGELNPAQLTGNSVSIDHGNDEFSFLAHLRKGSLKVKVGAKVKRGDMLGECGNSGNSSEAHLHYQLQNGPVFNEAAPLPAAFTNVLINSKLMKRIEPVQGQRVESAPR